MPKIIKDFYKTILLATTILILSAIPGSSIEKVEITHIPNQDKIIHFCMYLTLSFFLLFDYIKRNNNNTPPIQTLSILLFTPILYGGILELLQSSLFKERTADWLDFFANTAGSLVGTSIYHIIKKNKIL
jgi:VanZ family protein